MGFKLLWAYGLILQKLEMVRYSTSVSLDARNLSPQSHQPNLATMVNAPVVDYVNSTSVHCRQPQSNRTFAERRLLTRIYLQF
jgi:hypothetical protein